MPKLSYTAMHKIWARAISPRVGVGYLKTPRQFQGVKEERPEGSDFRLPSPTGRSMLEFETDINC